MSSSSKKKRLSGYTYRKKAEEKKFKESELVRHTYKINSFFHTKSDDTQGQRDASAAEVSFHHENEKSENGNQSSLHDLQGTDELTTVLSMQEVNTSTYEITSTDKNQSDNLTVNADGSSIIVENIETDPALWIVNDELREHFSKNGFDQNISQEDFQKSKRLIDGGNRYLPKDLFKGRLLNGEIMSRNYLIYSKSLGSVVCGPCRLFDNGKSQLASSEGLSDWKHVYDRLNKHENSLPHKQCLLMMKQRGMIENRVDSKLVEQLEEEKKYWRCVLRRVVVAVKALATRGLSFRGRTDKFGSNQNGNFMMILETIAEFDPFLAYHIQKMGNPGKGQVSYLSFSTYENIIKIMANKVTQAIIENIQNAKYFSFSVDSTPDITHVDQLSLIIRYVEKDGQPVERFFCFLPNTGHKAVEMCKAVLNTFETHNIDINNCRGQSYDNASNISGRYNGLQMKIKEKCPYALYIPCSAHSLNLIGSSAAECCERATQFFGLLQNLYVFFTASTQRWQMLQEFLTEPNNVSIKALSNTRWSARDEACVSLNKDWNQIISALEKIKDDQTQKSLVRNEATGLLSQINSLETAIMSELWGAILRQFNLISKKLQAVDMDIEVVSELYDSLISFVEEKRDTYTQFEEIAKFKSRVQVYKDHEKRKKKRTLQHDESREGEVYLTGREHFRVHTFLPLCDQLLSELRRRKIAYDEVNRKFAFLLKMDQMTEESIRASANKLQKAYPKDLADGFQEECILLKKYIKTQTKPKSLKQLCAIINEKNLKDIFPYTDITLRMFLCTAVTNCSAERSFSVLKRIKNYMRSRISEERLNCLAILNIESDLTKSLDYEDVVNDFANNMTRRKNL